MCADYLTDEDPLFAITTSGEEIQREKDRNEDGDYFEDSYIETLLVYRKLALECLDRGILLMHGSALAIDGEGYLFTALSGTGKSTHTRLWREVFGDKVTMINDDKPLVRVGDREHPSIIYGTPWDGKHHISNNIAVPLKAIVYLERGADNEIHAVSVTEIFPVLLQQTFRENDMQTTSKVLALLSQLTESVHFYDLHCNMDKSAAEVAFAGMNKE